MMCVLMSLLKSLTNMAFVVVDEITGEESETDARVLAMVTRRMDD